MGRVFLGLVVVVGIVVALAGVRGTFSPNRPLTIITDMQYQPRYHAQGKSDFFSDGRANRTPPAGTVAFGGGDYAGTAGQPKLNKDFLQADDAYYRGLDGKIFIKHNPAAIDKALLERGQNRFNIYCAVCHGATGNGKGITAQYGMVGPPPANLHDPRLRAMPDGEIFHVITQGKGPKDAWSMWPYGHLLKPADRWAVVAYVRVLQLSQSATLADVPEANRAKLQEP